MHRYRSAVVGIPTALALALSGAPATAFAKSGHKEMEERANQLPVCNHSLGTLAIREPDTDWWTPLHLGKPEAIIKLFVAKSHCFALVDRGQGLAAAQVERELAGSGTLQRRSNVGRGQVRAADYVIVPDLVTQNENAGGSAVGGILGTLIGGTAGALLGGVQVKSHTATVTLSVVDVRTTEIKDVYEGHSKKSDLGWAAGGGDVGTTGFGAVGGGGYTNTEQGQVIANAYLDAFTKFVQAVGGPDIGNPLPQNASVAAPQAALTPDTRINLRSAPSVKSGIVRSVPPGDLLYPTGQEQDGWVEVHDEADTIGWSLKLHLRPAK